MKINLLKFSHCFFLLVILFSFTSQSQENSTSLNKAYPIIPTPQKISYGKELILFNSVTIISNGFKDEAVILKQFFNENGIKSDSNGILIELNLSNSKIEHSDEAYSLQIDDKISIDGTSSKGMFYGVQSLKQLVRFSKNKCSVPQIFIKDWPAFKIRGFMYDTGRNYQPIAQLKEQIEVLARYKYNVFHWHLTDNPGWRLESKLYPELQSKNATSRHKGKYYTQDEFKEIVAFCKKRNIIVIPEFDIPGHTEAFRVSLGINSMKESRVLPILIELFDELMSLVSPEDMPYIHIGTDEVRNKEEYVTNDFILELMNHIKSKNRELIVWKEGIVIPEDSTSINQLWAYHEGRKGHRFIDSRSNYINHLDPFAGMARLYFQQPCRQPIGDHLALGGVLCAWPDNNVNVGRDILRQNPIYPSIVFYADAIWKGRDKDYPEYWAKLPSINTQEFESFKKFEEKVIVHRNQFFKGKEFPYVEQTKISWSLIGPFDNDGDFNKKFEVENEIKEFYEVNRQEWKWSDPVIGGTIHLKHFFGFSAVTEKKEGTYYARTNIYSPNDREQDFWVGFQGWSRSSRRGGPTAKQGKWHFTQPKIWVNGKEIEPPIWKQPSLLEKDTEIPFIDEDYFYRAPTKINLKKGWNTVLLKIPQGGNSWKWMFTCVPISIDGMDVSEVENLIFNPSI